MPSSNAELEFVLKLTTAPPDNSEVKFCTAVDLVDYSNHGAKSVLISHISIRSTSCITSRQIYEGVLRQKYLVDRLSMRDIACEFACSKTHIRNLLLKYNIPCVNPTDATTNGMPTANGGSAAKPSTTR